MKLSAVLVPLGCVLRYLLCYLSGVGVVAGSEWSLPGHACIGNGVWLLIWFRWGYVVLCLVLTWLLGLCSLGGDGVGLLACGLGGGARLSRQTT